MIPNDLMSSTDVEAVMKPFLRFWSEYASRADESARGMFEAWQEAAGPDEWRRRWLAAMSASMDAYLRSPEFLKAVKHNTDLFIKTKGQVDDLARESARTLGIPTTSDISGLFERLHSAEEVILERLARIESRLDAIEEKLPARQSRRKGSEHGE